MDFGRNIALWHIGICSRTGAFVRNLNVAFFQEEYRKTSRESASPKHASKSPQEIAACRDLITPPG